MNVSRRHLFLSMFALTIALLLPTSAFAANPLRTVWVSRTGTKYHYVSTCSNMSNPIQMTLSQAQSKGYGPCKTCVRETPEQKPEAEGPFSDVNASTSHHEDILWLANSKISTGYPDGTFRPLADVTRCDMAAFLYRLAGSPNYSPSGEEMTAFSDVNSSTYHAKEICWLASKGISLGYVDGTFKPLNKVTRQDMAAFLHRMSNVIAPEPTFSFVDVNNGTDHAGDIVWLASMGVSEGWLMPDGSREFRGMSTVKRADMAAFLHRMYNRNLVTIC